MTSRMLRAFANMGHAEMDGAAHLGLDIWRGHTDSHLGTPSALKWRFIYWSWPVQALLKAAAMGLMLLAGWDGLYDCSPRASYADKCTISHAERSVQASETLVIAVLIIGYAIQIKYKGRRMLLSDMWLMGVGLALVLCAVTLLAHIFTLSKLRPEEGERILVAHAFWVARALLRPVPFLHLFPDVRRALVILVALIPRVTGVFVVVLLVACVFALFGRVLVLDDAVPGADYGLEGNGFESLYESVLTTFWWAFGDNGPEPGDQIGLPGYKDGHFWAFYWVVFTILQTFYLIQVVTAVVFDEFGEMVEIDKKRREQFIRSRANDLLSMLQEGDQALLGERIARLNTSMHIFRFGGFRLFQVSETKEFSSEELARMILQHYAVQSRDARAHRIVGALRWTLENRVSVGLFRVAAALNAFLLLGSHETVGESESGLVGSTSPVADLALLVITIAYLADLLMALIVYMTPPRPFSLWQSAVLMRYVLTTLAITVTLFHACFREEVRLRSLHFEFHSLLLLQALDAIRIVPSMDLTFRIMAQVAPAMTNLVLALFCAMYSWSVIGVSIHRGQILTSNEDLADDSVGALFTMNFNTVFGGMYTLFMALYGNNVQQFTTQFYIVSGWAGLLHFFLFYLWGTLIAANVVISVLLDVHQSVQKQRILSRSAVAVTPEPDSKSSDSIAAVPMKPSEAAMTSLDDNNKDVVFEKSSETKLMPPTEVAKVVDE